MSDNAPGIRSVKCMARHCKERVQTRMTPSQEDAYLDAIACGSRGDGWDLYREVIRELKPACRHHKLHRVI